VNLTVEHKDPLVKIELFDLLDGQQLDNFQRSQMDVDFGAAQSCLGLEDLDLGFSKKSITNKVSRIGQMFLKTSFRVDWPSLRIRILRQNKIRIISRLLMSSSLITSLIFSNNALILFLVINLSFSLNVVIFQNIYPE
jgi:hypothetical protein